MIVIITVYCSKTESEKGVDSDNIVFVYTLQFDRFFYRRGMEVR